MQGNASLTAKQLQLIARLSQGSTIVDAARACKINEATAHRWLRLPHVEESLKAARKQASDELWASCMQQLKDAVPLAIEVLKRHAGSQSAEVTGGTQLRAGMYLLDKVVEMDKLATIEAQLAELQAIVKARNA